MSRQLFLAELSQYLTFVSPKEKEYIISSLTAKFDEVGVQGEPSLLMELGTPMTIAIALKRRKEAGETICPQGGAEEPAAESRESAPAVDVTVPEGPRFVSVVDPKPAEEAEAGPSAQETLVKELLAEEKEAAGANPEAAADITAAPPQAESEVSFTEEEFIPAISSDGAARVIEPAPEGKKLSAGGVVGAVLLSLVVVAVMGLVAAIGALAGYCGGVMFFAGLGTMSTIDDALWMFAIGLALIALGLFLLWLGIWSAIAVIHRLFKGRALPGSGYKKGMSRFTKTMLILALILLLVAVGCGLGGYLGGGYIDTALQNPAALEAIDTLVKGPFSAIFVFFG